MLRRCGGLAILGFLFVTLAPAFGQERDYNRDTVRALSKRIDEHLARTWKKAGVTPAPKAEDHVFYRRLHLDLVGRTPDLLKITDFVDPSNDSPDKRWDEVDKLLANYEHHKHFANVWRTIMLGYTTNQQFQFLQPQFEGWLREKIASDKGLDKVVYELLTSQNGANMGFNGQGQNSPQLFYLANENKAENLAGATSRVFLGVKIECAQCHSHPTAKWTKDQFWEFAAFYSAPSQNPRGGPAKSVGFTPGQSILIPGTDRVVKAKFLNGKEPDWKGPNDNSRKTLAEWVTDKDNPYFAKAMADHIWSYLMGVSLLEPIMEPSDDSPVTHPELLDDMARALMENSFDAKFLIRAIVHTDAYQRSSGGTKLAEKEDYHLFVRMPIRALSPEQLFDSVWMATNPREKQPDIQYNPRFGNPGMGNSDREKFLLKFTNQDRRHEPQTSILQALFLMNGSYLADKTKYKNNGDLKDLAAQEPQKIKMQLDGAFGGALDSLVAKHADHAQRISSLYMLVLSRPPRQNELDRLIPYLDQGGTPRSNDERSEQERLGDALSDVYWALLNSSEFLLNH